MSEGGVFGWKGHVCVGSRFPLELPKLAILNSAQGKQPLGGEGWIRGTLEALQSYAEEGSALVSSLGLNTWEFATWAGGVHGFPLIVAAVWDGACHPIEMYQSMLDDLALSAETTTLLLLPTGSKRVKDSGPSRDRFVASLAERVVPVSIRPGGRMEDLLDSTPSSATDCRFRREWSRVHSGRRYHFDIAAVQRDLDPQFEGWLIHWTRACPGPWPGETRAEYFEGILANWEEYAHSAQKTLERIVREKRLRPSSWRIRGKEGVVCLSGLPPSRATDLMRWRSRYVRYTIEPYGIGISAPAAGCLGIRPVEYLNDRSAPPDGIPAFFLQRSGRSGDWPREDEYRHPGGIGLETLREGEWAPIVLTDYCRS